MRSTSRHWIRNWPRRWSSSSSRTWGSRSGRRTRSGRSDRCGNGSWNGWGGGSRSRSESQFFVGRSWFFESRSCGAEQSIHPKEKPHPSKGSQDGARLETLVEPYAAEHGFVGWAKVVEVVL